MMDDVFVYFMKLPDGIDEFVTPCSDGFTVYIDSSLDDRHRRKAYDHAIGHIMANDYEKESVSEIEHEARRR